MELKRNVAEIKRLIQERKTAIRSYSPLARFLITKGVARSLAEEITLEFTQEGLAIDGLPQLIASRILTSDSPVERPIALVGPRGVELSSIAAALDHAAVAMPECSLYRPEQIDAVGEGLAEEEEGHDVWLVLSACMQEIDLYGAIHLFSPLCPIGLIITHLDQTLAPGVIMNVCARAELPIRYVMREEGVYPADSLEITRDILANFNEGDYKSIRQLTYSELY